MDKLLVTLKYIGSSTIILKLVSLFGILLGMMFLIQRWLDRYAYIKKLNTSNRKEKVNEVDKNGYKQLPATTGSSSDVTPTNVNAKEKLHIEIHGTASSTNEERIQDTNNLLKELKKYQEL